jgi:hypothetical protein
MWSHLLLTEDLVTISDKLRLSSGLDATLGIVFNLLSLILVKRLGVLK